MDAAGVPAADADGNGAVYAAESAAIKGLPQERLRQCAYEYFEKDIQALCSIIRTWVKATEAEGADRGDESGAGGVKTAEGRQTLIE